MQVFKCGLSIIFRNPTLLLVYAVCLSFMGIAMAYGSVSVSSDDGAYQRESAKVAVIDRDGSELSEGIEAFLGEGNELVGVEDSTIGLQDAVAKGKASYLLVIPEGFGESFARAAAEGRDLPRMESIYSYSSAEGALVDAELANYVTALKAYVSLLGPDALDQASQAARAAAAEEAQATIASTKDAVTEADRFAFYLKFDIYVFFAAIVSCLGGLLATLNRTDILRRNLVSPVSSTSIGLQTALACLVVTAVVWLWILALGAVVFFDSFTAIGPLGIALMSLTTFCFSLICLAIAFLIGQLGLGSMAANAIGNICGLVVSFLGGAWIPLDIAGKGVQTVAHFLPGFWYTDALTQAAHIGNGGIQQVAPIMGNIGVLLLYALAIFCIGMIIGRMRVQTAESGGNAAAALATP